MFNGVVLILIVSIVIIMFYCSWIQSCALLIFYWISQGKTILWIIYVIHTFPVLERFLFFHTYTFPTRWIRKFSSFSSFDCFSIWYFIISIDNNIIYMEFSPTITVTILFNLINLLLFIADFIIINSLFSWFWI